MMVQPFSEEELALLTQAYGNAGASGNLADVGDLADWDFISGNPMVSASGNYESQTTLTPHDRPGLTFVMQLANSDDPISKAVAEQILEVGAMTPEQILAGVASASGKSLDDDDFLLNVAPVVTSLAEQVLPSYLEEAAMVSAGSIFQDPSGQWMTHETVEHPMREWARNAGFQNLPGDQWDYENPAIAKSNERMLDSSGNASGLEFAPREELEAQAFRNFQDLVAGSPVDQAAEQQAMREFYAPGDVQASTNQGLVEDAEDISTQLTFGDDGYTLGVPTHENDYDAAFPARGASGTEMSSIGAALGSGSTLPDTQSSVPLIDDNAHAAYLRSISTDADVQQFLEPQFMRTDESSLRKKRSIGDPGPVRFSGMPRETAHHTGRSGPAGHQADSTGMSFRTPGERTEWLLDRDARVASGEFRSKVAELAAKRAQKQQDVYNRNMAARGLTPHSVEAMLRRIQGY